MKKEQVVCKKCGLVNDYVELPNGPHTEARCNGCGCHIKFLPKNPNPMKTFEQASKELYVFFDKTFPDAGAMQFFEKLEEEVQELVFKVIYFVDKNSTQPSNKASVAFEIVDCINCLMGIAKRCGIEVDELISFYNSKLQILKERKWKKQDDGTYRHV